MRLRCIAAPAAAVLLLFVLASSSSASAQGEESSSSIVPPVPIPRRDAININSTSSNRGAVKAIDCPGSANGTISVVGLGHSSGAPDVARIRMTVESTEPNAADARAKAAEATSAVTDALKKLEGAETRSTSVSVYTQRDSQHGVTKVTGFTFRQSLTVTLVSPGSDNSRSGGKKGRGDESSSSSNDTASSAGDSLASLASRALDDAIAAGGDRVSVDSLEFEMSPERQSRAIVEARAKALVDLREKAEVDAANLGLTLGALMTVKVDPNPRTGEPRGMRVSAAMASPDAKGPPTPLSSPNSETEVTAEGVYRVCSPS